MTNIVEPCGGGQNVSPACSRCKPASSRYTKFWFPSAWWLVCHLQPPAKHTEASLEGWAKQCVVAAESCVRVKLSWKNLKNLLEKLLQKTLLLNWRARTGVTIERRYTAQTSKRHWPDKSQKVMSRFLKEIIKTIRPIHVNNTPQIWLLKTLENLRYHRCILKNELAVFTRTHTTLQIYEWCHAMSHGDLSTWASRLCSARASRYNRWQREVTTHRSMQSLKILKKTRWNSTVRTCNTALRRCICVAFSKTNLQICKHSNNHL